MASEKITRKPGPPPFDVYEALDDSEECFGCGEKIRKGERFARLKGPSSAPFCSQCKDVD